MYPKIDLGFCLSGGYDTISKLVTSSEVSAILSYKIAPTQALEGVINWSFLNINGRFIRHFLHFNPLSPKIDL